MVEQLGSPSVKVSTIKGGPIRPYYNVIEVVSYEYHVPRSMRVSRLGVMTHRAFEYPVIEFDVFMHMTAIRTKLSRRNELVEHVSLRARFEASQHTPVNRVLYGLAVTVFLPCCYLLVLYNKTTCRIQNFF